MRPSGSASSKKSSERQWGSNWIRLATRLGLAARQYEAVDPDNRLVAAELEARWNGALQRVQRIEDQRHEVTSATEVEVPDLSMLTRLAADLPAVWNDSSTPTGLKQRIVRILIREIVADVDESRAEIVLVIHWAGGRHSELRVAKNKVGHHGRATEDSTVEIVRRMAGRWPDEQIAATLNRLGRKTGAGNTWTEGRVSSLRHYQGLPAYDPSRSDPNLLTMDQAARRLGVSPWAIRRLIQADMFARDSGRLRCSVGDSGRGPANGRCAGGSRNGQLARKGPAL